MIPRPGSRHLPSGQGGGSVREAAWTRPGSPGDNFRPCG